MKTREKSREQKLQLIQEANSPKSKLIQLVSKLENTPGSSVAARQLGSIIARLEDWQARHK